MIINFLLQTKYGTFVNNEKLEPIIERELFEDDEVGLGVNTDCDKNDRTNFVFQLKKSETVELNSDGDDDDNLEVELDPNATATLEVQQEKNPENYSISQQPTLTQIADLSKKQENLRHWMKKPAQLIDPLPQNRKRRKSVLLSNFIVGNDSEPVKKKRGRPKKIADDVKEKLKKLTENSEPKEIVKPKGQRNLKIKVTAKNRSDLLTNEIVKAKRGRPKKKV